MAWVTRQFFSFLDMKLPTEEDLRSLLVMPYLSALGIGPDRIRTERSFTLRLGHHVVVKEASRTSVGGRLDVLVTNDRGEPLFVAELKRESEPLTEDDRDQGISYARLMTPMAPFVLLTNGLEARIYDTVTTEELTSEAIPGRWRQWREGRVLATADDLRLRHEALQHFISYSVENLRVFLAAQRRSRMVGLRGDPGTHEKKYLPDVYVSRSRVEEALQDFLVGGCPAFVLAGPSGSGKTNEMCAQSERLSEDHPLLFLNGTELHGSLADRVADEFNWHFSEHLTLPQICARMATFADRAGKPFLIVVDAIDEAALAEGPRALSDLAEHLAAFGGRVRLLVSLKDSEWPRFARLGGNESPIARYTYRPAERAQTEQAVEANARLAGPRVLASSFALEHFRDAERDAAVERYRDSFRLAGTFHHELLEAVGDPFLLRMVAEAYAGGGAELPPDMGEAEILRRYLRQKLVKLDDERARGDVLRCAVALAGALLETPGAYPEPYERPFRAPGAATRLQTVPEAAVLEHLGPYGAPASALDLGASIGLLLLTTDQEGRRSLGFQYDRVRDFVVAIHFLRMDHLAAEEFRQGLEEWIRHPLTRDALRFYLRAPSAAHATVMREFARVQATRFLDAYERIRSVLGPVARERVDPRVPGPAGVVYEIDNAGGWLLAIFRGEEAAERVLEIPGYAAAIWNHEPRRPVAVHSRGGGNWDLVLRDPELQAAEWMLDELRELVEQGGLDDWGSELLMVEKVVVIVNRYRGRLSLPPHPHGASRAAIEFPIDLLPLDLEDLSCRAHAWLGEEYYKDEYVRKSHNRYLEEAGSRGERPEVVAVTIEHEQLAAFRRRAQEEAAAGRKFLRRRPSGGAPLNALTEALEVLRSTHEQLNQLHLPGPDQTASGHMPHIEASYSDGQLIRLLEAYFTGVLSEYPRLARANLGPIAERLSFLRRHPAAAVVRYWPLEVADLYNGSGRRSGQVQYTFVAAKAGEEYRADVRFGTPENAITLPEGRNGQGVETVWGRRERVTGIHHREFGDLISPWSDRPLEWRGGDRGNAPLHAWIYMQLEEDLKLLTPEDLLAAIAPAER
jgi:hypothetical protein